MADLPVLSPIDQRILGSLLEKERTVPASYPLTLNSLRTACNQTSSRDPVTDYDERTIATALSDLKLRKLVRFEHSGGGSRVMKYRQIVDEALELAPDERAVLTVLLLRGAQSVGEIKTRTERLHGFADPAEVERALTQMAARPAPLVREIARRPGWRDPRWVHLLGNEVPTVAPPAPLSAPPRELDAERRDAKVLTTYEIVAATYADMLLDELDHKPFDRWLLARLAALADGRPVADLGCGPGHVAALLTASGADVTGFDIAPAMITRARRAFPDVTFEVGDFCHVPAPHHCDGWGAIVAWYAFVHHTEAEVGDALRDLAHRLVPGGWLGVAVHVGPEVRHLDDWWGHAVDIDFVFHDPRTLRAAVTAAGFTIVEWYLRAPLDEVEAPSERLYILARRRSTG